MELCYDELIGKCNEAEVQLTVGECEAIESATRNDKLHQVFGSNIEGDVFTTSRLKSSCMSYKLEQTIKEFDKNNMLIHQLTSSQMKPQDAGCKN
jgi:hypothetical protein